MLPKAGTAMVVAVQLLAINDFHGHIEPPPGASGQIPVSASASVDAGGVEYLATHIKRLEQDVEHSYVVGAGDLIGGSPLISGLYHDRPTIEALGLAGLDLTSVGNHEFDEGERELRRVQRSAPFEYLAANVFRTGARTSLMPPYKIVRPEGIKLAFIGLTLETTPDVTRPDGVAGLEFHDEVATVNRLVQSLRRTRDVQAFVVLVHEGGQQNPPYAAGYEDSNGCEHLTGAIVPIVEGLDRAVDIVASAHTHQAYVCRIDGKVLTSAASFGRLITDLDLQLSRRTGDVAAVRARNVIVTRDVPKDRAETALVQRYAAQSAPIADRVVGTATEDLSRTPDAVGESEIGRVIADADRAATGAAVAFMNPGGIRGDVDAGDVTYGELFTVLPFGDSLVVKTLTGDQLYRLLAQQFDGDADTLLQVSDGFTYSYDRDGIVAGSVAIGGVPVDAAGSYTVAASSFLAAGGDGFTVFREAAPDRAAGVDLDALVSYVGAHSPLGAAAEPRITRRVASVF